MNVKPKAAARAFAERAFENYHEGLHRFLVRRLRNAQDASDVMQEVFLRVLQLERLEAVRNPQGYLYGIASHVTQEFRRRMVRDPVSYDSQAVARSGEETVPPIGDELADTVGIEHDVQQALGRLPAIQLRILVARQRDGLSYPEIGQALGLSPHTVRKYMDRALAAVRKDLVSNSSGSKESNP